MASISNICVYCGSQPGRDPAHGEAAGILGREMAKAGIGLVYGGGSYGIMGEVAQAVRDGGGKVTGIIPEFLIGKERGGNRGQDGDTVIITANMHERKQAMFERSDAFVALPGGIGTLEEVVEMMTWAQLGRHAKPIVFANVNGFWNPMLELLAHMKEEGFIHTAANLRQLVVNQPEEIVQAILDA